MVLLSCFFVSCGKRRSTVTPPSSSSAEVTSSLGAEIPSQYESLEVLPGDKAVFDRPVDPGQMPRTLVHDTPSMDKQSWGNYSYLGAAKAFKAICGFTPPEWVKPLTGTFYVSLRKSGTVVQSVLEFQIDPEKRTDLEKLIVEANAREFPQRLPVIFYSGSNPPVSSGAYIDFKADGKVKESMAVAIDEKGTVTLRASRGPVGWDD